MRANAAATGTPQVNWLTANQHFLCNISVVRPSAATVGWRTPYHTLNANSFFGEL
jgi:hypothetical protein